MKFLGTLLFKLSSKFKAALKAVLEIKPEDVLPVASINGAGSSKQEEESFEKFLAKQPKKMFGIGGWNQLDGTLPGGNHGYGCECWSCKSQTEDPYFS